MEYDCLSCFSDFDSEEGEISLLNLDDEEARERIDSLDEDVQTFNFTYSKISKDPPKGLTKVPSLGRFENLWCLEFRGNRNLTGFEELSKVCRACSFFLGLTLFLQKLPLLRSLELDDTGMETFPMELCKLTNLEWLTIMNNSNLEGRFAFVLS